LGPLIHAAAAIQVGLGSWTRSIGAMLVGSGIGVHTGLVDSWIVGALQHDARAISSITASAVLAHPSVCRFAEQLFQQGRLTLEGATYTHGPAVLGRINGLLAVNSVWQVDLAGRGNCEWLVNADGSVTCGGIGGLPDFAAAATAHPKGRSILCLRSTDQSGRSRIKRRLSDPEISLNEHQVDLVVTENGIAELRGRGPEERSEAILSQAASPACRAALT
jgi:acetyl-CoA hydrolase